MNKIIQKEKKYLLQNYSRPADFIPVSGNGVTITDINGKKYLDFCSGIAVNSLGHNNPEIVKAITKQAEKFIHISNLYHYKSHVEVAESLIENTCANRAFFCNSGTEANEAAIKFARKYNITNHAKNKIEIISFTNGFHGRTLGALSATAQKKFQKDFGPMVSGFKYLELNNIETLKKSVNNKTAAIFLEVIQGEGGGNFVDKKFVAEIKKLCKEFKVLLIADEIQMGLGRTGKFMGFEHFSLKPDIITLAKPLGGGLPLGAVLLKEAVAKSIKPGDHGTTFGGNPVACAAANVLLKSVTSKKFLDNVTTKGEYFKSLLKNLKNNHISSIRGKGLWICLDYSGNIAELILKARENGLIILSAGTKTIRFMPPLNVTKSEIKKCVTILKKSLNK